jgi:hypothetical protein
MALPHGAETLSRESSSVSHLELAKDFPCEPQPALSQAEGSFLSFSLCLCAVDLSERCRALYQFTFIAKRISSVNLCVLCGRRFFVSFVNRSLP